MAYFNVRPTLPSLHTLDLPIPVTRMPRVVADHESYERDEHQTCTCLNVPQQWPHSRRVSSTSSRTPSPSPSDLSFNSSTSQPHTRLFTSKFRLVPTTLETADAVIVVSPPVKPLLAESAGSAKQGQALLLLGAAVHHLRHSQRRQIANGARIHPYRIIRGADRSRRSCTSSTLSA